jgi:hypothetical protein
VNLLIGAFQSLNGQQNHGRLDSIYYEEERRLRLLVHADLDITSAMLGMIRGLLEDKEFDPRSRMNSSTSYQCLYLSFWVVTM